MKKGWSIIGRRVGIPVIVIAVVTLAGYSWHHRMYPYGGSHCCIIAMNFALMEYAETHEGRFPQGESSPEASLSLLYKDHLTDANTLRGMTVSEKTTRRVLESGQLLTASSCGWHYVEGLTKSDNSQLALLWCKEPLDHDGRHDQSGARQVIRVDGSTDSVSAAKWSKFLEIQNQLIQNRSASEKTGEPLVRAIIELPDHSRIEKFEGDYRISEESHSTGSSGTGSESGSLLRTSDLTWHRAPVQDGSVKRTLTLSKMVSDPVTITFSKGIPDTREAVFKMKDIQE